MQTAKCLPDDLPVITAVRSVEEARSLPAGSLVGDSHGGVTFSDAVASVLERRSVCGWRDIAPPNSAAPWTVIYLNR